MTTDRRDLLRTLSLTGAGSAVFGRALIALAGDATRVTAEMVQKAEWISGVTFSDGDRELLLEQLNATVEGYAKLRAVPLDNGVAPALRFVPGPPPPRPTVHKESPVPLPVAPRPASDDDLAFAGIRTLASLLKRRQVSSVELTRLALDRLRRFDPLLTCVITLTEDLALDQALRADREIAAGRWRGPLHGIPWAAKDLIAVPGYPTTWGSPIYRTQVRPEKATVAARLEEAGAVLVAKTSVGELAWGDVWFGGTTKNPWKLDQGSSGSSAGSASSVAAGLVPFAIGTETLGSIVSPATRCGASGLRPTFGRVSRHGVMALSPSMDKVGPLARSITDCELVLHAICGVDRLDPMSADAPPPGPAPKLAELKVGFVASLFDEDRSDQGKTDDEKARIRESQALDRKALEVLRGLGIKLVPIKLPSGVPLGPLRMILSAEAGATFDELTRSGRTREMVRQVADAWPNVFRQAQLIPAVEYLRANRARTLLMGEMAELMSTVDVYVSPTFAGDNLLLTNLTGHPQAVVPTGFRAGDGTPVSLTFTGRLFGEAALVAVAAAYQGATGFHLKRPPLAPPARQA